MFIKALEIRLIDTWVDFRLKVIGQQTNLIKKVVNNHLKLMIPPNTSKVYWFRLDLYKKRSLNKTHYLKTVFFYNISNFKTLI